MNKVQEEILLILQEECAEVIQAICKVKRFGLQGNVEQLEQEVADVLCMLELAFSHGILEKNREKIIARIHTKEARLKQYSSIFTHETTPN